ncbi:MAG: hypothetical protein K0S99_134 [Thermomicrobiales bacterium]|jgi:hypothetical protein|nr:hypothetical protein [Thermomicrobiales bacterium]
MATGYNPDHVQVNGRELTGVRSFDFRPAPSEWDNLPIPKIRPVYSKMLRGTMEIEGEDEEAA